MKPFLAIFLAFFITISVVLAIDENDDLAWQELSPMSVVRSETSAAVMDGKIYVVGGLSRGNRNELILTDIVEAYDIASDTWETVTSLPVPMHHTIAAAYNGKLYVFGGSDNPRFIANNRAQVFDLESGEWSMLANMPRARMSTQALVVDDFIYIVGGTSGREILRYDPATDTWVTLAESEKERDHPAVVSLDGKIYLMGGRNLYVEDWADVEIYNIETDTWSTGTPMNQARAGFGAVTIDGKIFVGGGELIADDDVVQSTELYNPESDTWTFLLDMPDPVHGISMVMVDDRIYYVGGLTDRAGGSGTLSDRVYVLDASANGE